MTSASLLDFDFVAWADEQARELRELGGRQDVSNILDWENLAEEIESVGRSQSAAVRSLVRRILVHLIKLQSDPDAPSLTHWRAEIYAMQGTAASAYTNAIKSKIDVDRIWANALREADEALKPCDRRVAAELPHRCPLSLDELVADAFDIDAALARLGAART